jgi:hypothetical protein
MTSTKTVSCDQALCVDGGCVRGSRSFSGSRLGSCARGAADDRVWTTPALRCYSLSDAEKLASRLNERSPEVHHEPRVEWTR